MKRVKGKAYSIVLLMFAIIALAGTLNLLTKIKNEKSEQEKMDAYEIEEIIEMADETEQKQDDGEVDVEENNYIYQTDKYGVSVDESKIMVESRKGRDELYWEEYSHYINADMITDIYFCDKNGKRTETEEDAYLCIDSGNMGKWWFDPFENLTIDSEVDPEYIPETLIDKMKEEILEGWYDDDITEMEEKAATGQLTLEELEERMPEKMINEILEEYEVFQSYLEVDFDNDEKKDIIVSNRAGMGRMGYNYLLFYRNEGDGAYQMSFGLNNTASISKAVNYNGRNFWLEIRSNGSGVQGYDYEYYQCNIYYFENGYPTELVILTFDPMSVNYILRGEMDKDKLEVGVEVKKKFVNDFINMSYGPW